jgi:hypothetical protein
MRGSIPVLPVITQAHCTFTPRRQLLDIRIMAMVVQVNSMRRMELDPLILRWKKTTRALKIHEQSYGKYITDILERRTDAELALFKDPVEAAAFFCLVDVVMRTFDKNSHGLSSPLPLTRQQPIIADIPSRPLQQRP